MDAQKKAIMGLKPCIAELVRTQYCPPSMVLLVQMVMIVPVQTPKGLKHAFRMMMTDGEKTIQGTLVNFKCCKQYTTAKSVLIATLIADMHWFVVTREIVVGAFVMLEKYKLAKAARKNKNGSIAYLQVADLRAVGYVDGYDPSESTQSKTSQPAKHSAIESVEKGANTRPFTKKTRLLTAEGNPQTYGDITADCADNIAGKNQPPTMRVKLDPGETGSHPQIGIVVESLKEDSEESQPPTKRAKLDIGVTGGADQAPGTGQPDLINLLPSPLDAFPRNVYRRKIVEHWDRCHRVPFAQLQSPCSSSRAAHTVLKKDQSGPHSVDELTNEQVNTLYPQACISLSQYAIYSIEAGKSLKRISRPLDIVTLKSLAGLAKRQNRICDILAIIETSPSPIIKRPHLPPKRDIKLSDPTTLKRITLSVFVDAEHFTPAIGTICLIRNVRNHRYDGQSLNAYPEDCEGYDWFIPNPELMVSEDKIKWLRGWWEERLVRKREWAGCEVDESDPEFGYPAEGPPPRERVFGASSDEGDD
ncbi:hypothetical protein FGG08_002030 [Glutinoglossum americanum]|uniref:Uncharacterized protein n=1 Tax=Glutinoglossum americanum TaxID=1670608 RepID=A0A9P8ICH4_9PEZI|nr:hypothetical protein FGG08_002030 [Glutinoglossum americanum]